MLVFVNKVLLGGSQIGKHVDLGKVASQRRHGSSIPLLHILPCVSLPSGCSWLVSFYNKTVIWEDAMWAWKQKLGDASTCHGMPKSPSKPPGARGEAQNNSPSFESLRNPADTLISDCETKHFCCLKKKKKSYWSSHVHSNRYYLWLFSHYNGQVQ